MTHLLSSKIIKIIYFVIVQGNEAFEQINSGESRFSRWFRTDAADCKPPNNTNQISPIQKLGEINHNENGEKNILAQFSPNNPNNTSEMSAMQSSFLELLQRGKSSNAGQ